MNTRDERERAALEKMKGRIARENQRRPLGHLVSEGERGRRLSPREVEAKARELVQRNHNEQRDGRRHVQAAAHSEADSLAGLRSAGGKVRG